MRYSKEISIAVAAALSASRLASATPPTLSQAASTPNALYIAGSSVAQNGILNAVQVDLCGGAANALTVTSMLDTKFFAVSCQVVPSSGLNSLVGLLATVYFRDEGDSVVGYLPIINDTPIAQLNLNDTVNIPCPSGSTACTASIGGDLLNNTTDSFGGAVIKKVVQLGITDLEPNVFVNDNFPSAYSTSVYGNASAAGLSDLATSPLFQQVFGVFVNVSGGLFGSPQPTSLNIPKAVLSNIFQGNVTDWNQASNTSGHALASSSEKVHIINREAGSGSRAAASIYFTGYGCNPLAADIMDPAGATGDAFSTSAALNRANVTAGAITYASIDNFVTTIYPNLALVAIDGVYPSNFNAASGQYDYWFEGTAIEGNGGFSSGASALSNWLITELQDINTEPHLTDVNAIPGNSSNDNPTLPVNLTANTLHLGGTPIYVGQFTRAGTSCNTPIDAL